MDNILIKILEAKEYRWNQRVNLSKSSGKTVISITMCVPYEVRTNSKYDYVYEIFISSFLDYFNLLSIKIDEYENKKIFDGIHTLFVCDLDAYEVKKACVKAEENLVGGRLFDIDVMDSFGKQISRESLLLPPRLCMVCNSNAVSCISNKIHKKEQIIDKVLKIMHEIK